MASIEDYPARPKEICKNCKWIGYATAADIEVPAILNVDEHKMLAVCNHPKNIAGYDRVDGSLRRILPLCLQQRKDTTTINTCSFDGLWWEAKPETPQPVKLPATGQGKPDIIDRI